MNYCFCKLSVYRDLIIWRWDLPLKLTSACKYKISISLSSMAPSIPMTCVYNSIWLPLLHWLPYEGIHSRSKTGLLETGFTKMICNIVAMVDCNRSKVLHSQNQLRPDARSHSLLESFSYAQSRPPLRKDRQFWMDRDSERKIPALHNFLVLPRHARQILQYFTSYPSEIF